MSSADKPPGAAWTRAQMICNFAMQLKFLLQYDDCLDMPGLCCAWGSGIISSLCAVSHAIGGIVGNMCGCATASAQPYIHLLCLLLPAFDHLQPSHYSLALVIHQRHGLSIQDPQVYPMPPRIHPQAVAVPKLVVQCHIQHVHHRGDESPAAPAYALPHATHVDPIIVHHVDVKHELMLAPGWAEACRAEVSSCCGAWQYRQHRSRSS